MKVHQLLEDDLTELNDVLLLMKHGKLDRASATKLAKELKAAKFVVSNRAVPANLTWSVDRATGTLKFAANKMPGSWRSGSAAVSRGVIIDHLQRYGFSVARFQTDAAKRTQNVFNGPHIFFWGPGTPPQDPSKLYKIAGTGEWRQHIEDAVKKQREAGTLKVPVKEDEEELSLEELPKALELRTSGSHLPVAKAKEAYKWLKKSGYRYHVYETEGKRYFKIVSLSFRNKDYRTTKGKDERLKLEANIRALGFKVGRHSGHVRKDADVSTLGWMESGPIRYVVFW